MKIVILDSLPDDLLTVLLADNVVYRPDLRLKGSKAQVEALHWLKADAVVCTSELDPAGLSAWRPGACKDVACLDLDVGRSGTAVEIEEVEPGLWRTTVRCGDLRSGYIRAFETLEHLSLTRMVANETPIPRSSKILARRDVVLVGAGLVNLVTAYQLSRSGWIVRVIDAAPDPSTEAPWLSFGCSRGGDDARMFTLSEMDNYNDRALSLNMNSYFSKDVASLGWAASRIGSFSQSENDWISDYESVPIWLADRYNDDIFAFTRDSRNRWDRWIRDEPDLFSSCETRSGILRVYSDPDHFRSAVARQERIGAVMQVYSPDEVAVFEPALRAPAASGAIAGGILVVGFTVNAHKFMAQLISRMIDLGVSFEWETKVRAVLTDETGCVWGLDCGEKTVEASNFVVSPGAYAGELLNGTRCSGRIHGVLGAWLRLPNIEPRLEHSLKLARRGHVTEDANVTVATDVHGRPIMIIGSGYGHTGIDPTNVDEGFLRRIYNGLIDTAQTYFPEAYAACKDGGSIEASLKYCVRPWTSNGLGLFEIRPVQGGGKFVVTGGHNTGGFAQSPTISDAVAAALAGTQHDMHILYHPDRGISFLERVRSRDWCSTMSSIGTPDKAVEPSRLWDAVVRDVALS